MSKLNFLSKQKKYRYKEKTKESQDLRLQDKKDKLFSCQMKNKPIAERNQIHHQYSKFKKRIINYICRRMSLNSKKIIPNENKLAFQRLEPFSVLGTCGSDGFSIVNENQNAPA
jgi:hypothetical protein